MDHLCAAVTEEATIRGGLVSLRSHLAKGSGKDNGAAVEVAQDFCDALLTAEGEDRLGRIEIIAVLQDMLFGGSDTSSAATEWALLELIRHPEKMTRLQAEVDSVLGLPGEAEGGSGKDTNLEALLLKLPYLSAVVKESFRLHTVGPFMIPHMTSEPVVLGGGKYHVPAGTMIQINAWAISHDPAVWPRPFEFEPERFLNLENIDFKGSDFSFFPFGSGRRMCPGYVLGSTMVYLMLAHLVHSFDWAAGPQGLDTTEKFGLSVLPLKSVEAIATPRF